MTNKRKMSKSRSKNFLGSLFSNISNTVSRRTGNVLRGTGKVGQYALNRSENVRRYALKKTGNVLRGTGKAGEYALHKSGNVIRGTRNIGKNVMRRTMRIGRK